MIDQNLVIADTGYLLSLFNQRDPKYLLAQKILEQYETKILITTCFVFSELYWLLLNRNNFHLIDKLFEAAGPEEIFKVYPFETSHLSAIRIHSNKYRDRKIDLADASLITLAEKIGHGNILTSDSDFDTYRWNKKNVFNNLFK